MPKEEAQSPKSNKTSRPQSLHHANAKRRSTMNSRDAAYDEEEQIRRAIAASRDVRTVENVDGCMKRGKRGRSESEEYIIPLVPVGPILIICYQETPRLKKTKNKICFIIIIPRI